MIYSTHVLSSGLRVIHLHANSVAEYCGVAIRAGSRDEAPDEIGLAHFVEHTIFKGTTSRRASSIINCMESVGGELNAYTTKEETFVYSVFPKGNLRRAAGLIADLVTSSVFPSAEIDREREVVAEEIDSYLDTPSEAVFDDFEDLMFANTSLGHNILGTKSSLAQLDTAACRRFVEKWYTAPNMVFFYLGAQPLNTVIRLVEQVFARLPQHNVKHHLDSTLNHANFQLSRGDGNNHQQHTIIGCPTPSLYSPDRHAMALLNNVLGGPGMNSRLNVTLREKRGLVYNVESSLTSYSDCGLMTIYFGCNPEDTQRCKSLVFKEIKRMTESPLSGRCLAAAKRQYIGQLTVASASLEQMILSAARSMLFHDRAITVADTISAIESISADDIAEAASRLSQDTLSSLTLE